MSLGTSLTHGGNSANYTLQQSAQRRSDRLSWVLSGFYESYRSLFDAKGKRIPPDPQGQGGIADTDAFKVFAKFGFDLSRSQSLFLSANACEIEQDTPYSNGAGAFGSRPAPVREAEDARRRPEHGKYAPNDDWRVLTQITHSAAQRRQRSRTCTAA